MDKIEHISCVIIAKNAETTIQETLESLLSFNEVILYMNNSTDTTQEIAKKYHNVKVIQGEFIGFGPTKNMACNHATNDWIFSLDSDEVLLPNLLKELKTLALQNENEVFILKRDNYFLHKKVRFSGWGNDYLVRLFNKKRHKFNQNLVHEEIELTQKTQATKLNSSFKHNAISNISQQLQKIEHYSSIYAEEKKDKKHSSPLIASLKALFFFIKTYFFKLGILDGFAGFMIAVSGANGVFYKYIKLYIENQK